MDIGVPFPVDNLQRGLGVQILNCHPLLERGVEAGMWSELRVQSPGYVRQAGEYKFPL